MNAEFDVHRRNIESQRIETSTHLNEIYNRVVPYYAIAKGDVAGESLVHKFGRNSDIDLGTTPEDVWLAGGLMTWPTAAAVVSVTSASANDTGSPTTNTGAHTLTIEGLDASFAPISETITLNGGFAVTTTASFIRVNRAFVATTGTYHGSNEGLITGTIGGSTMFTIGVGIGQTQIARYTVPAGFNAYILGGEISVDSGKTINIAFYQSPSADDVTQPYGGAKRLLIARDGLADYHPVEMPSPRKIDPKTDLWWEVSSVSANNTSVTVDFYLSLEQI